MQRSIKRAMKAFSKLQRINRISFLLLSNPYSGSSLHPSPLPPPHLIAEFNRRCYENDLPRAMKAMSLIHQQGLHADCTTYSELIKTCIARNAVEEGKLIHKHLISNGHQPKTFLLNILLNMYVKFRLLDEAHQVFDEMPERNVVAWTTIISAYSSAKIGHRALKLMVLMLRDGVKPNMYTFSSVLRACDGLVTLRQLHCCIFKCGLESDVFVRSALVDVYAKWGELGNAISVFDEMMTKDLVVWNSIIGAFAQNGNGDEALDLFKRMKRAGFLADQGTLTSTLRACTGLALLELGRQVHVHVLKYDKDLILNNALVDMYCKCGGLEDANRVFMRMEETDVISWSTMISGFAQNGFSQEALNLFDRMKISGPRPNYITILGVLFACSHAGLVEQGWFHFRSMKKLFGIETRREHYGCMIDLLGRAGKLEDAVSLIHQLGNEADAVTWRTLLGACRVHRNADMAIYAAKQILKLEPEDAGTYVLLSNIYSNSQRWEEAMELRRTMINLGIKKEPGCSWIEVNKQIHTFIFRDRSHPQIDQICSALSQLIWRLRETGYVPDTSFVLQDLEGEQKEDLLQYHSEKLAIAFGLLYLPRDSPIRIRKNLRICGDCHLFAKLVAKMEGRVIVIRDLIRYHHFKDGICSCGDYW